MRPELRLALASALLIARAGEDAPIIVILDDPYRGEPPPTLVIAKTTGRDDRPTPAQYGPPIAGPRASITSGRNQRHRPLPLRPRGR
jgi:hypothetical protein